MEKIKVYVKLDTNNVIKEINSSIFLSDTTDFICVDEGVGDKYAHAHGHYLPKGLIDNKGRYNYKYIDEVIELTEDEKAVLFPEPTPEQTDAEVLNILLGVQQHE